MKTILFFVLFCPMLLSAQERGICFLNTETWQDVLQKAKKERKYIFVDCYATWCGPCKMMDEDVYNNDSVGRFMNEKFLSVKLQMDSSGKDGNEVRRWYTVAKEFGKLYNISAYPSYLFFSPDGEIVHKDIGRKSIEDFVTTAASAFDVRRQYYTLLAKYQAGNVEPDLLRCLAMEAANMGQDSLGTKVAMEYKKQYLDEFSEDRLWSKENIRFVVKYLKILDPKEKLFRLLYKDRELVDSVMGGKEYSRFFIFSVVFKKEIYPSVQAALAGNFEPDWVSLKNSISGEYSLFDVDDQILYAQTRYYQSKKIWDKYSFYIVKSCELDTNRITHDALYLNNCAFEVFKYSRDTGELERALFWANRAVMLNNSAAYMDTQANLLYKLGKTKAGLDIEQSSAVLDPSDKVIQMNLRKMKEGIPTWVLY